jgi:hypothetical protein
VPPVPYGLIAERRLIERLLKADAVGAGAAQPLENLRWTEDRRLRRLISVGVVREAAAGRYYLDAPALAARMANRRKRLLVVMLLVAIALMVAFALAGPFG